MQLAFALALGAAFAAHAAVSWAVTGFVDTVVLSIDGALLLLALVAGTLHAQSLARDRRRHVIVQELASAFAAPRDVRETARTAAALFVDSGLATAALVAVAHAPGDRALAGFEDSILTPVARVGFPADQPDDAIEDSVAASAFATLSIARERAAADRWLFALGDSLGARPLVARVPLQRGDELLGALLLVSPQAGPLHDRRLLETMAALLGAALDNARLYDATFEQTRDLEAQDARRREFLYAISHELRTPLTSIRAFAELLTEQRASRTRGRRGRPDDEEQLFTSLSRGVERLSELVEDLLRLGRAEEVVEDIEIGPLDARTALETAASIIRPAVMLRGQALHLHVPEEPVGALGEQRALEHVLINLLSNANRHTPEGGMIEAHLELRDDVVRFEVSDSGPGIAPADRERIFEPFFRVRRAGTPVPGSGLGLAVARRAVGQLGGRLWVEDNQDGTGARFCVELPSAPASAIPPAPPRAASLASHAKRPPPTTAQDEADDAQQLHLDLHERSNTPG